MDERITLLTFDRKAPQCWRELTEKLKTVKTPYVMMLQEGDKFLADALERVCAFLDAQGETLDVAMMKCSYQGRKGMPQAAGASVEKAAGIVCSLEKREDVEKIPFFTEAVALRTEAAQAEGFDESNGYETWEEYLYRVLGRKKKIGYVQYAVMLASFPAKSSEARNKDNIKKDWYLKTAKDHLLPLVKRYRSECGKVPPFIQSRIVYELKIRFESNKNRAVKYALTEEEKEEFFGLCREILQDIDDIWLMPAEHAAVNNAELSYALSKYFLELKYGAGHRARLEMKNPTVYLDLVNCEKNSLVLDFSCAAFLWQRETADGARENAGHPADDMRLKAIWNGQEIPLEKTQRYADTAYFGRRVYRDETFRLTLPCDRLKKRNRFAFITKATGGSQEQRALTIGTRRYTSRITPKAAASYWCFDRYMIRFGEGNVKKEIIVERAGRMKRIFQECRMLYGMTHGRGRARRPLLTRLWYWLYWPVYHKKNIWLTFDKIYKGGDNGEYFYKYMVSRKDTDVVPAYLMNADAPDRRRLEKEGYQPLIYGSKRHRMMFLHAKMIFATHAGIYNFNHIAEKELPYLQNLMNADAVCIQHGLSVQNLEDSANRAFNNNKRYYCASKYEVENLLKPAYGYDDPEAVRLTGVPRYDGLVNDDQKQILITPTWRNYVALPATERNSTRPYFDGFKETDYFKVYNELISDRKLVETAARTGYRILYLVHPNISAQAKDFTAHEGVEVIPALEVNYEKVLTQSSLMVTDYTGVQFDFAYMRKPVVYYHSPKLPPHYEEGGFFYDTQGFGEICTSQEELVDTLCAYMENGCRLKPFYEARENDFFAFADRNNCQRIFEDAFLYQKSKENGGIAR